MPATTTEQAQIKPEVERPKSSEEEEVKSGGVSPPQINSCAGTQEDGSGASQKSDTSSSSVQAGKNIKAQIKIEEEEEADQDCLEGKWWLKGIDKKAIEQLAMQGQDLDEEPVIYE